MKDILEKKPFQKYYQVQAKSFVTVHSLFRWNNNFLRELDNIFYYSVQCIQLNFFPKVVVL